MWKFKLKNITDSFFRKEKLEFESMEIQKENKNKSKEPESMIVYVDENGHLTSTPQIVKKVVEISETINE